MLVEAGKQLWLADGPVVRFLGLFPYPTRMAVARLRDGSLWIWSPIALDDALVAELAGLGAVRQLVAPNKLHHLFLGEWKQRFPEARLHAAPGLARRRRDLAFDAELGDAPDPAWAGQIDQLVFRGSWALQEVVFFHRASRTALVADLIQRVDPKPLPFWARLGMRLAGLVGPAGATPRDWRATWWKRRPARAALAQALAWNAERLVIAHGELPTQPGREALARGLGWLRS